MAPELTVGLVVHNDPAGLVKSAACVFNQSWNGTKVLGIVDDGSTDDTPRVISSLVDRYGAVEAIRNERREGGARARNHIMHCAPSRYLAWIDAGDLWHPRKLELQFRALSDAPWCRFVASPFPELLRAGFIGLLGESAAYREIGDLDEQLTLLADEEFLIRLALSEIPYAQVELDHSLCMPRTRVSDSDERPLAADARVIWRRHKSALRERFGSQSAAEYRRRSFRTFAWRVSARGRRGRSVRDGARAAAKSLFQFGVRLLDVGRLTPTSRLVRALTVLREAPVGRRLVTLAPGLAAFTSSGPTSTPNGRELPALSSADRAALTVAYVAIAAKRFESAVGVLEQHIVRCGADAHPRLFERLANAHLAAGCLDRTEIALREGLSMDPSDGRLRLALADVLARRSRWAAAVECWEQVPQDAHEAASVWTYIRIARAYRISGNPKEALIVATRAAARYPGNDQLEREIVLCRPSRIDWSHCLVSADAGVLERSSTVGTVETLGFLAGGSEPLAGRLAPAHAASPEVQLRVNGLRIASTLAAEAAGQGGGRVFSINCADLLQYLGDGDIVQIVSQGKPVTFSGLGAAAMIYCGLPSRLALLKDELAKGYVFDKFGQLRPGHTAESKRAALDLYAEVSGLIESSMELATFPFYGTLLGAVRESDFIDHDVGGFDMVVVCESQDASDVKVEFIQTCRLLIDRGYHLTPKPWGALIRRQQESATLLDLTYGWLDSDGEFKVAFGWRFSPVRGREDLTAHRVCRLANGVVRVPGNAERVLEQLYGPQWRVPDQGYAARNHLQRDVAYLMTDAEMSVLADRNAR